MQIHFIAIGGAIMHQLAICLQKKGHKVSGSDDVIFDPARSNLAAHSLLPEKEGWYPAKITPNIEAILLGMHAKKDNPELEKALKLGIPIYSFPEFFYKETADKLRVVIGGSHGKTTITSMLTHVLQKEQQDFDILVGAKVPGVEQMVQLHQDTKLAIIEGDEYLSSPIDSRPKFIHYKGNIAVINGIAWDHINVFPTFELYVQQFRLFINSLAPNPIILYNALDYEVVKLIEEYAGKIKTIPYEIPEYNSVGLSTILNYQGKTYPLSIFGKHNMNNLEAARLVAEQLGISAETFLTHISDYTGASRRLEVLHNSKNRVLIKDFAHAPSKVNASVNAVKESFPGKKVIAFFELHTYSSLNPEFMPQYKGALSAANEAFVFYDNHALKIKNLPPIKKSDVKNAFGEKELKVINSQAELEVIAMKRSSENAVFLLMSSGSWGKTDLLNKLLIQFQK